MYIYDETKGKRGEDNVTEILVIFSNKCAGQNKDYTLVCFLYFIVHVLNIFLNIIHIFPNDRDFSIISKIKEKSTVGHPGKLDDIIKIIHHLQYGKSSCTLFSRLRKPPLELKTLEIYKISKQHPGFIFTRNTFWFMDQFDGKEQV